MAKSKTNRLEIRQVRTFSEEFKRQKVQLIVEKKVSIADVSTLYQVSKMTVYRWLYKYSPSHEQGTKQVVQMQSEEYKTKELLRQVADLERSVGQKQLQIDYLERLVLLSGESLKIDLKKTFGGPRSNGFDSTKPNPDTSGPMKALYEFAQISKQAHLASIKRLLDAEDDFQLLTVYLTVQRGFHPAMSLKKMFVKYQPDFVGRDEFIEFGMNNGFEAIRKVGFHKTTHAGGSNAAPPEASGLVDAIITDINQLWVSDLFYLKVGTKHLYVVLIEDVFSRKLLGWNASDRMFASANLAALRMALKTRGISHFNQKLIHHSDKGTQYRSLEYTDKLRQHGLRISMGNCCYDNAFMESGNGIIKNEYLIHRPIKDLNDLLFYLNQDATLYNSERPHGSLNRRTPDQFERYIDNIPLHLRTSISIFTDKRRAHNLLPIMPDNQQLRFQFPGFR